MNIVMDGWKPQQRERERENAVKRETLKKMEKKTINWITFGPRNGFNFNATIEIQIFSADTQSEIIKKNAFNTFCFHNACEEWTAEQTKYESRIWEFVSNVISFWYLLISIKNFYKIHKVFVIFRQRLNWILWKISLINIMIEDWLQKLYDFWKQLISALLSESIAQ